MTQRPPLAWGLAGPVALLTLVPLLVILSALLHPDSDIWQHLWAHVLPEVLKNTVWLALGVAVGVLLLGVPLGWLTATCEFPGRRWLDWALLLPLALPGYVTAFVWVGLLDFTSPVAHWLQARIGLSTLAFANSLGGLIFVMSLALYPYVYLSARAAFAGGNARLIEAAQSLGLSRSRAFLRVALPMALPGILAGLLLVLMETLADFGTVSVFNYNTFTTAIYQAWFAMFSLPAAAQLASMLLFLALALIYFDALLRARRQHALSPRLASSAQRQRLRGWHAALASGLASLVLCLAFIIPLGQLLAWSIVAWKIDMDVRYLAFAAHSLLLGGMGSALVVASALALAYAQRLNDAPSLKGLVRIACLGYALPGSLLAVGIFMPVAWLDNALISGFGLEHPLFAGTLVVMLLAYATRFTAVGFGPIETGLKRISPGIDEAAQILGSQGMDRLRRIHLPMLRVSVFSAAALAFVDIMKELPITLMTRPFGWDTLAVRVFEMTSEGEWERAALPALAIVLVGLLPVAWLMRLTHIENQHA